MKSLPVLYKDEHLVGVNKPSGLLVHRSAIETALRGLISSVLLQLE